MRIHYFLLMAFICSTIKVEGRSVNLKNDINSIRIEYKSIDSINPESSYVISVFALDSFIGKIDKFTYSEIYLIEIVAPELKYIDNSLIPLLIKTKSLSLRMPNLILLPEMPKEKWFEYFYSSFKISCLVQKSSFLYKAKEIVREIDYLNTEEPLENAERYTIKFDSVKGNLVFHLKSHQYYGDITFECAEAKSNYNNFTIMPDSCLGINKLKLINCMPSIPISFNYMGEIDLFNVTPNYLSYLIKNQKYIDVFAIQASLATSKISKRKTVIEYLLEFKDWNCINICK